jgi:putative PIN family toxin of toxin-antitoxin system
LVKVLIDTNTLLSGIFFDGNEREVLMKKIKGEIELIVPQYVRDEAKRVMKKSDFFSNHPYLDDVKLFLDTILETCENVTEKESKCFKEEAKRLIGKRDKKDIAVLQSALFKKPEYMITGDKDFLEVKDKVDFKIVKTRDFLEELSKN